MLLLADQTSDPSTASVALAIFGILSSCGALAWWWRSGTKVNMADRTATEANRKVDAVAPDVAALKAQMAEVSTVAHEAKAKADAHDTRLGSLSTLVIEHSTVITEIRTRMAKLDRVDEIVGAVNVMRDMMSNTVPRTEIELQRSNDTSRILRVEEDIRGLSKSVHSQSAQ